MFLSRFQSRKSRGNAAKSFRPQLEQLESLLLLSFADGNGPVVTGDDRPAGSNQLVITFDGPLNPAPLRTLRITRSPKPWRTRSS